MIKCTTVYPQCTYTPPLSVVSCAYSIIICDVDISSVLNKGFHYVHVTSFSCNVQGSPLSGGKYFTVARVTNVVQFK